MASNGSRGKRNIELGKRGENAAAKFLDARGYEIIERNWKCFAGEADIVALDGDTLVFVEVKTRRNCSKGFPSEHVDAKKRSKYEKIALAYVADYYACEIPIRFDIISIVPIDGERAMIRHDINAFGVM